jgi:outer membrane lipoprotein-sorting protein
LRNAAIKLSALLHLNLDVKILFANRLPYYKPVGFGGTFILGNFISNRLLPMAVTALTTVSILLMLAPQISFVYAQDKEQKKETEKEIKQKDTGKVASPKEIEKDKKKQEAAPQVQLTPAETIAEFVIIAYGTRPALQTARANIHEEGTIKLVTESGNISGNYSLRQSRREKSIQDLLRVDLELTPPDNQSSAKPIKYIIAYNGASVWSAQNDQYRNPAPEAEAAFQAQLTHDYTSLLRYKEDGATLELKKAETVVGVDCNVLEMTSPDGSKTTYWISAKTYRILHLEYSLPIAQGQQPVKYRISFFYTPFRVIQNTLVPTRRVMMQNGKLVQEVTITQFNYSAKFDPEIFQHLP